MKELISTSKLLQPNNIAPRRTFVPLNWYGRPSIESKSFRTWYIKSPQIRLRSAFKANLDITNCKNFSNITSNYDGVLLVSPKYTLDMCTSRLIKTLGATPPKFFQKITDDSNTQCIKNKIFLNISSANQTRGNLRSEIMTPLSYHLSNLSLIALKTMRLLAQILNRKLHSFQ